MISDLNGTGFFKLGGTKRSLLQPKDKRLAVRVEEHPLDYADFEGVIPKGEYGGGTVLLWDKGYWTETEDFARGLEKGSLKLRLDGKKIKGRLGACTA